MRLAVMCFGLLAGATPSLADGFHYVVPGRANVPVVISGVDASYGYVEGDWGLQRGTRVQPTVYGGRVFDPQVRVGRYFPSSGEPIGYGRLEIEPPEDRALPKPAENFNQSWSVRPEPPAPRADVPFEPPTVIVAPPYQGRGNSLR